MKKKKLKKKIKALEERVEQLELELQQVAATRMIPGPMGPPGIPAIPWIAPKEPSVDIGGIKISYPRTMTMTGPHAKGPGCQDVWVTCDVDPNA